MTGQKRPLIFKTFFLFEFHCKKKSNYRWTPTARHQVQLFFIENQNIFDNAYHAGRLIRIGLTHENIIEIQTSQSFTSMLCFLKFTI